jgi:hypothetical protein
MYKVCEKLGVLKKKKKKKKKRGKKKRKRKRNEKLKVIITPWRCGIVENISPSPIR